MNQNNYVVLNYRNGILGCGFEKNNIVDISFENTSEEFIGNIYVAKVTEIVKNISSAFILYGPDKKGYLSLKEVINPVLLNREYDGRLLSGDELLVQLDTQAIRSKFPCFTTNLSIAGNYAVVSNGKRNKAVSSKIEKRYEKLLLEAVPDTDYGVVVRTNAASLIETDSLEKIKFEVNSLINILDKCIKEGIHRTVYSLIYKAPGSYLTGYRDNHIEYDRIITDDMDIYNEIKAFLEIFDPDSIAKLSLYESDSLSLTNLYSINTKVEELLDKKVWLKSGAYLIIEQTEAMYVIDVNSGKNTSKKDNEQYIYNINLEAAKEIMRQLRLRNLSGMILVDFINMSSKELENKLFLELTHLSKKDPVKTIIVDYTKLGLLEITRKKAKKSLKCQLDA